jgi:hypothetical protein
LPRPARPPLGALSAGCNGIGVGGFCRRYGAPDSCRSERVAARAASARVRLLCGGSTGGDIGRPIHDGSPVTEWVGDATRGVARALKMAGDNDHRVAHSAP